MFQIILIAFITFFVLHTYSSFQNAHRRFFLPSNNVCRSKSNYLKTVNLTDRYVLDQRSTTCSFGVRPGVRQLEV